MSALLDTDQMTRNMRRAGTGWKAVLAKKHPKRGFATCRGGGHVLHDVLGVRVDYRTPEKFDLLAVWRCGSSSMHPVFPRPKKTDVPCPRCLAKRAA